MRATLFLLVLAVSVSCCLSGSPISAIFVSDASDAPIDSKGAVVDRTHQIAPLRSIPEELCSEQLATAWLDLIFLVDSSERVQAEGFSTQMELVAETVSQMSQIGQGGARIGIVNVGNTANVILGLNESISAQAVSDAIQSIKYRGDADQDILSGLNAADEMITSHRRPGVPVMVLLFFSKELSCPDFHEKSPCGSAARLRARATLATMALNFKQTDTTATTIATPCFSLRCDAPSPLEDIMSSVAKTNCFCPEFYHQMIDIAECKFYRTCVYQTALGGSGFFDGSLQCKHRNDTIATIKSPGKEQFLIEAARKLNETTFWTGLRLNPGENGTHYGRWDDNTPFSDDDFNHLRTPLEPDTCSVVSSFADNTTAVWRQESCSYGIPAHPVFCERSAFDTENQAAERCSDGSK